MNDTYNYLESLINDINDAIDDHDIDFDWDDFIDAEQHLLGNFDLLAKAVKELQNNDASLLSRGPEACDVLIRLYLLPEAVDKVVNDKVNNL